MNILVLDNYDSFTYNLVYMLRQHKNTRVTVLHNRELTLDTPAAYDKILLSPGPGVPKEAGLLCDILTEYAAAKPMLGICLGHQAIGEVFGSALLNLTNVYHGVATPVQVVAQEEYLFHNVPRRFMAGRYHSWVIDPATLPDQLAVTATTEEGTIMGISHKSLDVKGLQFHPESVLTEYGAALIANWVKQ